MSKFFTNPTVAPMGAEILEQFFNDTTSPNSLAQKAWDNEEDFDVDLPNDPTSDNFYDITIVESNGGEGDGAKTEVIFAFECNGKLVSYFLIAGTYSSWADSSWDDKITFVKPRQVEITVYEAI